MKSSEKDPKIIYVSLTKWWSTIKIDCQLFQHNVAHAPGSYIFFTAQHCILLHYSNHHMMLGWQTILDDMLVANRDGLHEYQLCRKRIEEAKGLVDRHLLKAKTSTMINAIEHHNKMANVYIPEWIDILQRCFDDMPEYTKTIVSIQRPFTSYLSTLEYKTNDQSLKDHYVVFDLETNGVRKKHDDILSLSIYDPTTGMCYNRMLPLDLQPMVLTSFINGITENDLVNATHLTQDELDWLIDFFHLKKRVMLSYSGGKGTFDPQTMLNYCKRHGLRGWESLTFENIKSKLPPVPSDLAGQMTKDNICRLLSIKNVTNRHTSQNDCLLEWKLYERLSSSCLFFTNEELYEYHDGYVIPVTSLIRHPILAEFAHFDIPKLSSIVEEVFHRQISRNNLNRIRAFGGNLTGITLEHGLNVKMNVCKENNAQFLIKNKSKCTLIGSLPTTNSIEITLNPNGLITSNDLDVRDVEMINEITSLLVESAEPALEFIRKNIFNESTIRGQELVISKDKKVLALCDWSDNKNVVEIKTDQVRSIIDDYGRLNDNVTMQLFYQSRNRNTYLFLIEFRRRNENLSNVIFHVYKVTIKQENKTE